MYSIENTENIFFKQTKQYYEGVLSSFFNANYRAAIVMLYSVAISDLCLKLNDLSNTYDDAEARSILAEIETTRNDDTSKSKWEKDLIEKMCSKGYISPKLKSDMQHLFDDRCFSAHPSMNRDFELLEITKETALAHIKNILNELFVEPPMFNKNVIDRLTNDLEDRKDIFENNYTSLNNYLCSTYFSRLTIPAQISLFKSLWSFCFNKKDDEKCKQYSDLTRMSLISLCRFNRNILKNAQDKGFKFDIANEDWCLISVCIFLSEIHAYDFIVESNKDLIKRIISINSNCLLVSWFTFDSFSEYIEKINATTFLYREIDYPYLLLMRQKYVSESRISDYIDFCIKIFSTSCDFYDTDSLYVRYIAQNLNDFNVDQLYRLLDKCNKNYCIYNCNYFSPKGIYSTLKSKLGKEPDIETYRNLQITLEKADS